MKLNVGCRADVEQVLSSVLVCRWWRSKIEKGNVDPVIVGPVFPIVIPQIHLITCMRNIIILTQL